MTSFHVSLGHLVCLLWRNVYLGLCAFFSWLVSFFFILYVFISWKWSACQSVCRLSFHFVYGFLSCAKACTFDLVSFVYFCFISIALGDWPKKTLVQFMSENVLPKFSSRSFMAPCLMCKSSNLFGFIFLYGVWKRSALLDLRVTVQLSQYHLLKRLSSLHWIFLPPLNDCFFILWG